MSSPSPRPRIDQFFPSRKKKTISPKGKICMTEKSAEPSLDQSPSSKRCLDCYLSVNSELGSQVTRSLSSGATTTSDDARNEPIAPRGEEICDDEEKGESVLSSGVPDEHMLPKTSMDQVMEEKVSADPVNENVELRQFATDFLSLYCRELPATPSVVESGGRKRSGSPFLLVNHAKTSKKRQYVDKNDNSLSDGGHMCSNEDVHCGTQATLRKCNSTPYSRLLDKSMRRDGTPKWLSKSSMVSPGDEFWNEAIQMADGLDAAADKCSVQIETANNIAKDIGKQEKMVTLNASSCINDQTSQLGLNKKHSCDTAKLALLKSENEESPLPIRHFDFAVEEKTLCEDNAQNSNQNGKHYNDKKSSSSMTFYYTKEFRLHEKEKILPVAGGNTPSSSASFKNLDQLSNWLPFEVCNIYMNKGISKLYPWQVECLQIDGVLQRRNLVYCASTSAGKSFVAEILMLRRVIMTGKIALLVLPYVSICAEKAQHLEGLLEPLKKHVRSFYGNEGGANLSKDTSVAVCTIEKANSLVNRLLEEGRLSELGIIVIDELHMVGDQSRGYLLELLLTKLRYAAGEGRSESFTEDSLSSSSGKADFDGGLQIVGMSATMPNVAAVADWLQAALYQTNFRPVPLEEYVKVGNVIYNKQMEIIRQIRKTADHGGKDPDHVAELCDEVVQEGHSVLIFCSSRKGCESTARHVSKFLKRFAVNIHDDVCEYTDALSAIEALRRCSTGLDPILEETLPAGVAYHHAGLTVEERDIIETCYRKGLLRVLAATSTLAAGVNLPARRVIFRQPKIGRDFLDGTRYRQMAGRAGRTGIDSKGESILICKSEELKRIVTMLNQSCPALESCLADDKNGMTHAILEVVASGIVQTADDIHRYVRCTLLNSTKPFEDVVRSAQDSLRWLCHHKFLEWSEETKLYNATPLGRAAFGSSLNPDDSLVVLNDLSRAREGFVLASDLHLVYLVTPINVEIEPDWELYYERFMELSVLEQAVGNRVGISEPFLMRMAHGAPMHVPDKSKVFKNGQNVRSRNGTADSNRSKLSDVQVLRVGKRFYVSLMLSRLVQEVPVQDVCEAFKVSRGMVQALQDNAGRFASMVSIFCERLSWHDLEGLVTKFQKRVSFGVRAEIVELTTIPYVKGSRARALYKAGLRSPLAIAESAIPEIVKAIFGSSSWAAQENFSMRKIQLGLAKKIKNGACKIVLEQAEEARIAAFAAFKSLGVVVPQLSQPLIPENTIINPGSPVGQEASIGFDNPEHKIGAHSVALDEDYQSRKPLVIARNEFVSTCDARDDLVEGASATICSENFDVDVVQKKVGKIENDGPKCESNDREKKTPSHKGGPVSVNSIPGGFTSFLEILDVQTEFHFDIHFTKRSEKNLVAVFEIYGIAFCWNESPVYYLNIYRDLVAPKKDKLSNEEDMVSGWEIIKKRWARFSMIMEKTHVRKCCWDLKLQAQVLQSPCVSFHKIGSLSEDLNKNHHILLVNGSYFPLSPVIVKDGIDQCIVAWLLWPDEESNSNPNLEKEVKKRLPNEVAAAANRDGRWRNQTHRAAYNGCCHRVAQIRALHSSLWRLLTAQNLIQPLSTIEMPLVNVLAEMELCGIGVNMEFCLKAKQLLLEKLRELHTKACKLAGRSFSLSSTVETADILYNHLKLPVPEGSKKGKQHPSTDKHSLDLLRDKHEIVAVIKEYRTLSKLLNCTLGSICLQSRFCERSQQYTVQGNWLQTSTSTGRLSVEEPNLQCVEHLITFTLEHDDKNPSSSSAADHLHQINARDFLIPTQDDWLLLGADYSQIELRLMANFSRDSSLIELLNKPDGDVFKMMAARWTGRLESDITSKERDQTKRLVYGILYGMGANTLAEQLECSTDEAVAKIQSFKASFPGVSAWLCEAVKLCRQKGYIETLNGRKRFLTHIKYGSGQEISKAQRQAVNSICQGSAADIIKTAMIRVHSVVSEGFGSSCSPKFSNLKGRCRILLQVHDELLLEVDSSLVKEAALLLKESMETAASLLVPLHVKLKVGKTWGSMESYQCAF